MQPEDPQDNEAIEESPQQPRADKPQWVKPVIRARGSFDKQALACSRPQFGPPFCQGGAS